MRLVFALLLFSSSSFAQFTTHGTLGAVVTCSDGIIMVIDSRMSSYDPKDLDLPIFRLDGIYKVSEIQKHPILVIGKLHFLCQYMPEVIKKYNDTHKKSKNIEIALEKFNIELNKKYPIEEKNNASKSSFLTGYYKKDSAIIFAIDHSDKVRRVNSFVTSDFPFDAYIPKNHISLTTDSLAKLLPILIDSFAIKSNKSYAVGGYKTIVIINKHNKIRYIQKANDIPYLPFEGLLDIVNKESQGIILYAEKDYVLKILEGYRMQCDSISRQK